MTFHIKQANDIGYVHTDIDSSGMSVWLVNDMGCADKFATHADATAFIARLKERTPNEQYVVIIEPPPPPPQRRDVSNRLTELMYRFVKAEDSALSDDALVRKVMERYEEYCKQLIIDVNE